MTGEKPIVRAGSPADPSPSKARKKGRLTKTVVTLITFGVIGLSPPHGGNGPGGPVTGPAAPAAVPIAHISSGDQIKVHCLDVGQADCIYIQLPDNTDILIDGGDQDDGPAVVEYLERQGLDGKIELLIATHPHRDHIGGLPEVMEAFEVKEVLDSGLPARSDWYESLEQSVAAEGCRWVHDNSQVYEFGQVHLQILTGGRTWKEVNNNSVVARLDCGQVEFLFTGDIGKEAEERLTGDIGAEILKVGHHGSSSSTSAPFLAQVHPETAIISAGAGNSYGHPHPGILARLRGLGIRVHRTDWEGTIVIETDGDKYWIRQGDGYVANTNL